MRVNYNLHWHSAYILPIIEGVAKVHPGLCGTRKGKNAIFPFLAETTTWRRHFWQHIHVLHEAVATLSLLRQPLIEVKNKGEYKRA